MLARLNLAISLAVVGLAQRFAHVPQRRLIDRTALTADYLSLRYQNPDQEIMGALYLDVRSRLIAEAELYRGTLSCIAVEPRGIFKQALLHSAAAVVLFHTHPSGDPTPSSEDLAFTRRMAEAGKIMGIRLVDHIILGHTGRWVSLKSREAC